MLSRTAASLVPAFGHLTITAEPGSIPGVGSIIACNHDSLADPAVVVAALHRVGIRPVIMATAGLWRVPLLGRMLTREGHIAVHRRTTRAADALEEAAEALAQGRHILIYGEGGLPRRKDSAAAAPLPFRTGLARLAHAAQAPVVPVGQAGARRITSGSRAKQLAGVLTAPIRRPRLHVHIGTPLQLPADIPAATAQAHQAVTRAWKSAAQAVAEPAALAV
ncbi:lysophospholipid acyltransferase family protein [Streptomyces abikoensis]|uniref:lysophospholipid acyltransferase family protein n=1 Tax=Streptomyces abikoensis TaxID=97398 RepID=UPI0033DF83DF